MFSLIISIVAIALVVVLAAATMYYGGDALTQGRTSAEAASYVTAAQQIGGAAVMHTSTLATTPADVAALVTSNTLSGVPNVKSRTALNEWVLGTGTPRLITINLAGLPATNLKLCEQINKNAGGTGMDATAGTVATIGTLAYACVPGAIPATDPQVFQFKF